MKEDVLELGRMYQHLMQVNTDYGVIPGTPKPTLLKPGAELLCLRFGYSPSFETDSSQCDFDRGFIYYRVTCKLYAQSGVLVGCGMGSCNSYEPKYRYRWLWGSEVPAEMDKAKMVTRIVRRNNGTPQYRVDNPDPMELDNTILKMAMKRAHIAATLNATGASRIFTQDVEDMTPSHTDDSSERVPPPAQKSNSRAREVGILSPAPAVTDYLTLTRACRERYQLSEGDVRKLMAIVGYSKLSEVNDWPQAWEKIRAHQEPPTPVS
jgi:hypothetical protein